MLVAVSMQRAITFPAHLKSAPEPQRLAVGDCLSAGGVTCTTPNNSIQSFVLNLGQLPLQVVPGLGAAGAGGRAGLPKPTTTGAYFLEPGAPQFRPLVPSRAAPGALDGGGFEGPGSRQMDIWSQPLGSAPQVL